MMGDIESLQAERDRLRKALEQCLEPLKKYNARYHAAGHATENFEMGVAAYEAALEALGRK